MDGTTTKPRKSRFIPKPKLKRIPVEHIDFEKYIKRNCENKIKILERKTFAQITQPIIIIFNHFREKCNFHTQWLDKLYQASVKYGENIEFIAADIMDIDILYPGRNPLTFFSRMKRPENQTPYIYAIDEKKRIHESLGYNKENGLEELSEDLLNGKLYPSQPIPTDNNQDLIKICVYDNYEEMVLNSKKNIFLIINNESLQDFEHNYNELSTIVEDLNLDIVYMEAEKNYIPFEYHINFYPTIIFIPCEDKRNFIYYDGFEKELEFLKKIIKQPEYLKKLQDEQNASKQSKSVEVSNDFKIAYKNLCHFLREKYNNTIEILDRDVLEKSKCLIFIAFMDFQGKCLAQHIEWLNKLNQLAEISAYKFFIADFEDIDVINTKWHSEDIRQLAQGLPRIYVIDRLNHTYEFGNFNTIAQLYYFADSIEHGDLYYSQVYNDRSAEEGVLVKEWTADYFHNLLYNSKNYVFIIFYSSAEVNREENEKLFNILTDVAQEVKDLNVDLVKYDVHHNYVDLEYTQEYYPVYYFIDKDNKKDSKILNVDYNLNKDIVLEFIKQNMEESTD